MIVSCLSVCCWIDCICHGTIKKDIPDEQYLSSSALTMKKLLKNNEDIGEKYFQCKKGVVKLMPWVWISCIKNHQGVDYLYDLTPSHW